MKRRFAFVLSLLMFIGFLWNGSPASAVEKEPQAETRSRDGSTPGLADRFISFYRNHISAVDGDRCPSYPTCSSYSAQAFRKHGFVMGWLMTVDRLIHEGKEEAAVSPLIRDGGTWRIYDPVENNDFWWHPPEKRRHEKE
jgi:hypothetical protein